MAGVTSVVLSVRSHLLHHRKHHLMALVTKNLFRLSGLTVVTDVFHCLPSFFVIVWLED